jgi:hypothetical protein
MNLPSGQFTTNYFKSLVSDEVTINATRGTVIGLKNTSKLQRFTNFLGQPRNVVFNVGGEEIKRVSTKLK